MHSLATTELPASESSGSVYSNIPSSPPLSRPSSGSGYSSIPSSPGPVRPSSPPPRLRRTHCECSCPNKFLIDLTIFFGWLFLLRNLISDLINSVKRVTYVKPYVTGFWEEFQTKEYCLGPVVNPLPSHVKGEHVYVVIKEETALLRHLLWPSLEVNTTSLPPAYANEGSSYDYGVFPVYATPDFVGQLYEGEVTGVHRATYVLLVLSRLVSLALVHASQCIAPRPIQKLHVLKSEYSLFPLVPTPEQLLEAEALGTIYKPLSPDLIRGAEALHAARRAGYTFNV